MKTMLIAFLLGLFVSNVVSNRPELCGFSTEAQNTYWDCVESKMTEDQIKTTSSFLTCVNKDSAVELINYFCNMNPDEPDLFQPIFSRCLKLFPASFNTADEECLTKASQ
ncbi:venom protein 184-like [Centruroides sculpturatus]|uniref:venom protein 184-like n=1 Tax=Centruroides sculpturatus TaxID=218467 RepID=UPI000C6D5E1F|nr:venom protein 184-like [Centruroides sculpturatus]XP_023232086.1 venom protein 184-like [Centruroides sculpturatus]